MISHYPHIVFQLRPVFRALFIAALLLSFCHPAAAQDDADHPVRVSLLSLHESLQRPSADAQPGTTLALQFDIEPGWHVYWKNSGESGTATKVEWTTSNGWQTGALRWQTPYRFIERGEITTYGYKEQMTLLADVQAEAPVAADESALNVAAKVKWLVCKDVCIPGRAEVETRIPYGDESALSADASLIQRAEQAIPQQESRALETSVNMLHEELTANAESVLVLRIRASFRQVGGPIQAQLFPGPSKQLSLGAPEWAWHGGDLVGRAPLRAAAGTSNGRHTLPLVLALPDAMISGGVDVAFEQTVLVGEALGALDSELAASLSAAEPFSTSSYRYVHYSEHAEEESSAASATTAPAQETLQGTAAEQTSLALILLFAFIGGMILNLMPCVLPIIAIKVMGFVEQTKSGSKGCTAAFCSGIMFSFLTLAAVVITLRSLGVQLGWGFQFQHPEFVFVITLIVFVLSLGFFDLYVIALPYMQRACSAVDTLQPSRLKHFFDGVIATILSTPCTAPFLGTALVFAFTQGPLVTLAIHIAIGLGLATPYFLLASNPKFMALLPKPGNWMHRVRQLMGFMLLGTVVWLLFVLQKLTGEGVIWCLTIMLALVFSIWLYDWSKDWTMNVRRLARGMAAAFALVITLSLFPRATLRVEASARGSVEKNGITWEQYSPARVQEALAAGVPVFVDFTADWCITCKANEKLIINTDEVAEAISRNGVLPLIADWTAGDPVITEALSSYGARGVPLYVVLSPEEPNNPVVLSTIPSKSALIDAFDNAAVSK